MEPQFILIPLVALVASLLTFFSGFGLGTILTPAFLLFFPVEISITLTAVVHFLNNIFKVALIGKHIDKKVILRFGFTAILGAFVGAYLLVSFHEATPLFSYSLFGNSYTVELLKLLIGILMIFFSLFELLPRLQSIQFDPKILPYGGLVSGFFGGLSGHQGALRSAFLIKCNLSKEAFIATGIGIALAVDVSRITTYFVGIHQEIISENLAILLITLLFAFMGAFLGKKVLVKITYQFIQLLVGILIIFIGLLLGMGII